MRSFNRVKNSSNLKYYIIIIYYKCLIQIDYAKTFHNINKFYS